MDLPRIEKPWPALPVFFASTEGQAERIATKLAQHFRARGLDSSALDLDGLERSFASKEAQEWEDVIGVVLCASVHYGKHQRIARRFAEIHCARLGKVPSLFASVSLASHSSKREEREAAEATARAFGDAIGWTPNLVAAVAGALAYTRYSWWKRLLMKSIASREGGAKDTTRDHEYTDWQAVESWADRLTQLIASTAPT